MVRSDNFPTCLRLRRRGGRGGGAALAHTPLPAARVQQSNTQPGTGIVPDTGATNPDTNTPPCPSTVPATDTTDPETAEELRCKISDPRTQLATADRKNAAEAAAVTISSTSAIVDELFASHEATPTLRFWGLENVPGTVSVATVRAALGPGWRVVDRMLGLERVVVATATTDEPAEARLAEATGTDVSVFPYRHRTPAASRSASDVVIVHCVAETAPTLDSALLTLLVVGFPLLNARRVFLPRAKGGNKKGSGRQERRPAVHQVYVQMASPDAAQAVCPPRCEEEDLMPAWDAAFCYVGYQTCVHVLQVARAKFEARRCGAVAEQDVNGFWSGRKPDQVYGFLDSVACPPELFAPASVPVVVEGNVEHLSGDDSGSSGEDASCGSVDDRLGRLAAEWVTAAAAAGVADAATACAAARDAEAGAAGAGAATKARGGGGEGEDVAQSHPAWRDCGLTTFEEGVSPIDAAATLPDAAWQDTVESSVDDGDSVSEMKRLKIWAGLQVAADAAKKAAAAAVAAAADATAAAAAAATTAADAGAAAVVEAASHLS